MVRCTSYSSRYEYNLFNHTSNIKESNNIIISQYLLKPNILCGISKWHNGYFKWIQQSITLHTNSQWLDKNVYGPKRSISRNDNTCFCQSSNYFEVQKRISDESWNRYLKTSTKCLNEHLKSSNILNRHKKNSYGFRTASLLKWNRVIYRSINRSRCSIAFELVSGTCVKY